MRLEIKKEERKKRNHVLIQIGAAAEKVYKENNNGKTFIDDKNIATKFEKLFRTLEHDNYLSTAINEEVEEGTQEVENNTSWNERVEQAKNEKFDLDNFTEIVDTDDYCNFENININDVDTFRNDEKYNGENEKDIDFNIDNETINDSIFNNKQLNQMLDYYKHLFETLII